METLTFRASRKFAKNKEGKNVLEMAFGAYWEFIISGKPLQKILDIEESDYTSVLPVKQSDNTLGPSLSTSISRILAPSTERVMLYHCGSCADEGCGFFTVKIEEVGNRVIWSDFAFSNSEIEGALDALSDDDLEIYNNIPTFEFDRDAYIQAFEQLKHLSH